LRKLELLTRPTQSQVSFNHFSRSTSFISFLVEAKQTFPRLSISLGALEQRLVI
jgi:hypothetical protein